MTRLRDDPGVWAEEGTFPPAARAVDPEVPSLISGRERRSGRKDKSLGLQLVSDLAKELGGALTVVSEPPTAFEVVFQPDYKRVAPGRVD